MKQKRRRKRYLFERNYMEQKEIEDEQEKMKCNVSNKMFQIDFKFHFECLNDAKIKFQS